MPKVEAWLCPKTGLLFNTADYRRHLAHKAATNRFAQRRKAMIARAHYCLDDLHRQTSFVDIAAWIEQNAKLLFQVQIIHGRMGFYRKEVPPKGFAISEVTFRGMVWKDECRITHCAPIGKRTNWGHDKSLPTSYPGYNGHIHFVMDKDGAGGSSDIFRQTGINTGSGGGGGRNFSYEVTLFADDWPMLILNDTELWGRRRSSGLALYEGNVTRLRKLPPQKRLLLAHERA